jgi:hypothetical protein
MCKAKVMELSELDKLKAEKMLTAKKCCVDGCESVGQWRSKNGYNFFELVKGMCQIHYSKFKKYGDPLSDFRITARERLTDLCEIDNLKEKLRLTATVCSCDGCEKIGVWHSKNQNFYLIKGMCIRHYTILRRYGNPFGGKHIQDGRKSDLAYTPFMHMINRCENKMCTEFSKYGEVGIAVSDEFHDFWIFKEHIGERPSLKHSIDRYPDKNGNYERGNVRWATDHMQNANKNNNNEDVGVCMYLTRINKYERWMSYLNINGKRIQRYFLTKEEAIAQRRAWEIEFNIYNKAIA